MGLSSFATDYGFKKPGIESWTDLSFMKNMQIGFEKSENNIALKRLFSILQRVA